MKRCILISLFLVLWAGVAFGAWTYSYDTSSPDGSTQPVSVLDDHIRLVKQAIQERANIDHYWPLTGTQVSDTDAGKHRRVLFYDALSSAPTVATDEACLYPYDVNDVTELYWKDEDGNVKQLTSDGALNVVLSEWLGTLTNDTYFTAIDEAGTGTVDLIKAGKNEADDTDVAVLPDETRLATNAAPTEDTQVPNKKYVDDAYQVAYTETGTRSVCTTTIPHDNTIPQVDEGDQVMSRTFTPKSSSSLLRIDVVVIGSPYTSTYPAAALFETSVDATNALAVGTLGLSNTDQIGNVHFTHLMNSPGTSELTFRVRAGCHAGSFYFNGGTNGQYYGGELASSITVTEYPGSGS